jgi:hypothetical protein
MGGADEEVEPSITTDSYGAVYVTGAFTGTWDFDPSNGTTSLSSNGNRDIFVQKLDNAGNLLWAKSIGGISYDEGTAITTDGEDNVIIFGYFTETVDFDPGPGVTELTSHLINPIGEVYNKDIFILKLNPSGDFIWAKSIKDGRGGSIALDLLGNIYISGLARINTDFDPGAESYLPRFEGPFLLKLDPEGKFIWAKQMAKDGHLETSTNPSDGIYLAGNFSGTVDFDPGPDKTELTSNGLSDIFILRLDMSGNLIWAKAIGGEDMDFVNSLAVDENGDIYITGEFRDTVDFDPGSSTSYLTSNSPEGTNGTGSTDIFVLKLTESGSFSWANRFGDLRNDSGRSITIDPFGNIYVTGFFVGTMDFGSDSVDSIISNENTNTFVIKLSDMGNPVWAAKMDPYIGASINIDTSENVIIAGSYWRTANVDPGFGETILNSTYNRALYTVKLNQSETELELPDNISVYPNPSDGLININLGNLEDVTIKMFSVSGQLIYHSEHINNSPHQFEYISGSGIYLLELISQDERELFKLIIK